MPTATTNPVLAFWQKFREFGLVDTIFIVIRTVFPARVLTAKAFSVEYRDITNFMGSTETDAACRPFRPERERRIADSRQGHPRDSVHRAWRLQRQWR